MNKKAQEILTLRTDLDAQLSKALSVLTTLRSNDNFKSLSETAVADVLETIADLIGEAESTKMRLFESLSEFVED
ncbi:MAG: hypothetical protein KZQ78_03990 [Candidatus Thiodiazotropha sp. (ex Ustalcina ferruginea)]|nr:hypothetical protein [Candidatus Thiodiazotropha sp. (ex Ustalcina ferruginea)]